MNKFFLLAAVLILLSGAVYIFSNREKSSTPLEPALQQEQEQDDNHADYEEPEALEPRGEAVIIEIANGTFKPMTMTVKPGTTIAFKNTDSTDQTVVSKNSFDSGALKPGQTLSVIEYDTPGTYTFNLQSNPNVTGTIIVSE